MTRTSVAIRCRPSSSRASSGTHSPRGDAGNKIRKSRGWVLVSGGSLPQDRLNGDRKAGDEPFQNDPAQEPSSGGSARAAPYAVTDAAGLSVASATLTATGCKARYGVAYLRSICSQAGVGMTETSPDEDVLAVDCELQFPEASVRVQVKCTSRWTMNGQGVTWPVKSEWVRKWDVNVLPVYFVVVVVPDQIQNWLRHDEDGTFHATAAYWTRLVTGVSGSSVRVPAHQRLSAKTLGLWHAQLMAATTPAGDS